MARTKKRKNGHKKQFTVPISIVAGFAGPVSSIIYHAQTTDQWHPEAGIKGALTEASRIFTGWSPYEGKWIPSLMKFGTVPVLIGMLVHKIVGGKLGVNRALASAGVPFIRL